jgi:hypothetical protein
MTFTVLYSSSSTYRLSLYLYIRFPLSKQYSNNEAYLLSHIVIVSHSSDPLYQIETGLWYPSVIETHVDRKRATLQGTAASTKSHEPRFCRYAERGLNKGVPQIGPTTTLSIIYDDIMDWSCFKSANDQTPLPRPGRWIGLLYSKCFQLNCRMKPVQCRLRMTFSLAAGVPRLALIEPWVGCYVAYVVYGLVTIILALQTNFANAAKILHVTILQQ